MPSNSVSCSVVVKYLQIYCARCRKNSVGVALISLYFSTFLVVSFLTLSFGFLEIFFLTLVHSFTHSFQIISHILSGSFINSFGMFPKLRNRLLPSSCLSDYLYVVSSCSMELESRLTYTRISDILLKSVEKIQNL